MKIVIAPDSFKGSIDAVDLCSIIGRAAKDVFEDCEVVELPVADGGEGTVDSLIHALGGSRREIFVHDANGNRIKATYGIFGGTKAIIEMSSASGLPLISENERNVLCADTYGSGELILDAVENGCQDIFLGIGGSATNDGGAGALRALGVQFLDEDGNEVTVFPRDMKKIVKIDVSRLREECKNMHITIMCDVNNPLLGDRGASAVFGPQKGASPSQVKQLDSYLKHYADVIAMETGTDHRERPGTGAAGGLGYGLMSFLSAEMNSGIETVLDILEFDQKIQDADVVVTGEGRMDFQSQFGKVPCGIGLRCMKQGVPCIAITGCLGDGSEVMFEHGIESMITTVDRIESLAEAFESSASACYSASVRAFRLIRMGMKI